MDLILEPVEVSMEELPKEVMDELHNTFDSVQFLLDGGVDDSTVTRGCKVKPSEEELDELVELPFNVDVNEFRWLYKFRVNVDKEYNHATIRSIICTPSEKTTFD